MNKAIQEIEALFNEMEKQWNRHDIQAYAELWTEDADFVNVLGMHRGSRQELQAELDFLHAGRFKNTQVRLEQRKIRLLTPEVAVAHVWWEMNGDPGMPGFPTRDGKRNGVFTHVLQQTPQGWRFVASQNTDTLPIPDPLRTEPVLAGSNN